MSKRDVLGCGAGIAVTLIALVAIAIGATLLIEEGMPERLLVRFGAMLAIVAAALGYRLSLRIRRPSPAGEGARTKTGDASSEG